MIVRKMPVRVLSLHTLGGRRKYVNHGERARFIAAAATRPPRTETLCLMLAWTGCRISEALGTTYGDLDPDCGLVSVRCLKKRREGVVREVPVPRAFLDTLARVHGAGPSTQRLWPIGRTTAWRQVKAVMDLAEVGGFAASPKGLRHGFGVHAVRSGVPLNMLQRWLGHADIATTSIYTDLMGPEEREVAARMWAPSATPAP